MVSSEVRDDGESTSCHELDGRAKFAVSKVCQSCQRDEKTIFFTRAGIVANGLTY